MDAWYKWVVLTVALAGASVATSAYGTTVNASGLVSAQHSAYVESSEHPQIGQVGPSDGSVDGWWMLPILIGVVALSHYFTNVIAGDGLIC